MSLPAGRLAVAVALFGALALLMLGRSHRDGADSGILPAGGDTPHPISLDRQEAVPLDDRRELDHDRIVTEVDPDEVEAPGASLGVETLGHDWLGADQEFSSSGPLIDGKRQGLWRTYRDDGTLWTETEYVDGRPYGSLRMWSREGRLLQEASHDREGRLDGKVLTWHENGQLASEAFYVHGKRSGPDMEWYESGEPKTESTYLDGFLSGPCRFYAPDGTCTAASGFYEKGKRVHD